MEEEDKNEKEKGVGDKNEIKDENKEIKENQQNDYPEEGKKQFEMTKEQEKFIIF